LLHIDKTKFKSSLYTSFMIGDAPTSIFRLRLYLIYIREVLICLRKSEAVFRSLSYTHTQTSAKLVTPSLVSLNVLRRILNSFGREPEHRCCNLNLLWHPFFVLLYLVVVSQTYYKTKTAVNVRSKPVVTQKLAVF